MSLMIDFINSITVRARAAFYLAIAESLSSAIEPKDKGYTEVRQALDECWRWLEGGSVSADKLYEYFANENDTGVEILGSMVNHPTKSPAWNTAGMALAYIIWQAYKIEGEKYLPADIEEVNETMVEDLLSFASESKDFDKTKFDKLKQYLLKEYASKTNDEQGSFMAKDEIMNLLNRSFQNI